MVNPKSAFLVAVLTAGLAYHPDSTVAPPSAAGTTRTPAVSPRTVTYDKDLAIKDWPLRAIYESFIDKSQAHDPRNQANCPAAGACRLRFIIATVPDPQNSQYPFIFDAFMQSIQRAFGNAGYNLDQFWLPWDADPAPVDSDFILHEQHRDWLSKLQANPGVLVFRKNDFRTCVLLVGENAITGIQKDQFSKAARIVLDFAGPQMSGIPINVLGPTFTGSVVSLKDAILALPTDQGESYSFDYVTGSATGSEALQDLTNIVARGGMTRHQTIGAVGVALNKFLAYAKQKTSKHQVAMLREAGTTFSRLAAGYTEEWNRGDQSGAKIKIFEYPIQISRLRNAYGSDPELGAISNTKTSNVPRQGLEIPLKDEHESEDHMPVFSTEITPVSQESAILSTLATIDRKHIEYVMIVASDIMDSMFLGRLLKQHCPNTRPFILDADLIYGHSSQNNTFDGMLMATNYPLFYRANQGDNPQFSSAAEEGEYWATLQLISHIDPANAVKQSAFVDSPWLAVVGRDGVWPIEEPDQPKSKPSTLLPIEPSLGWKLGFYFVSVFCVAFSAAVIFCNWNSLSQRLPLGWFSALLTHGSSTHLVLSLAVVLLLAFYSALAWFQLNTGSFVSSGAVACLVTMAMLLTAGFCGGLPKLKLDEKEHEQDKEKASKNLRRRNLGRILLQAGVSLVIACFMCAALSSHSRAQTPLLFRTVHVSNGVSPVVPIAFTTAALFWLACTHLNRLRLLHLFPAKSTEFTQDAFLCRAEHLQNTLHEIMGSWTTGGPRWAIMILFALCFSAIILDPFQISSVETFHFEYLYAACLYAVYFGLLLEFTRFLRTWATLQSLLRMLERHMLSRAFRRLGKKNAGAALWHWGGGGHSYQVLAQFLNRLKWLSDQQLLHSDTFYEDQLIKLQGNAKDLMGGGTAIHLIDANSLHEIKMDIHAVFVALVRAMLTEWRTLSSGQTSAAAAAGAGTTLIKTSTPTKSLAVQTYSLAEEMIALRFVEVISQVNLQLKNNLEFIAGALILAVISLNSYPFEPRHSMTTMITIYFFSVSAVFLIVFMQMSRNTIISYLSNTTPGKLDGNIFHVLSFGGLPMLAVISSQFPSVGGFLFAWVKPALETLR